MQAGCIALKVNREVTMKYICQLAIIAILLSSGACAQMNNAPRHTADEVIMIAKSFSPQCQVKVASEPCG